MLTHQEERAIKKQKTIKGDIQKMLEILQLEDLTQKQLEELELIGKIVHNEILILKELKSL